MSGQVVSGSRVVAGTIDAGGVYCSRVAAGGGFVFLAGTALDDTGRLADAARPPAPYQRSHAAQARFQTQYLFEQYRELLPKVGSSVADILQLEQYVKVKVQSDGYFAVALGPGFMGGNRPGGATAQLAGYYPAQAQVSVTGLAIVPNEKTGAVKSHPDLAGQPQNPKAKFSDLVAAGPYVFTTYFPSDNVSGVPAEVRQESWIWRGSEIRAETEYGLDVLRRRLDAVGAGLEDIVDYTLFLTDPGDLYEFDLAFGAAVGERPPSRSVIPTRGTALPRREGAFGHGEGAPRMEAQFRCLRPGHGASKEVIAGPGAGFGYQSAGVRCGPLLWLSSQFADDPVRGRDTARQVDDILGRLEATCANAGTDLRSLLRLRAVVSEPRDALAVFAGLRKVIPSDPPTVSVVVTGEPLYVEGATVALDGVAYVAGE